MKVWPGLPCWKLTNEHRAGSKYVVMKQTKLNLALIQKANIQGQKTRFNENERAIVFYFSSPEFTAFSSASKQGLSRLMHALACTVRFITKDSAEGIYRASAQIKLQNVSQHIYRSIQYAQSHYTHLRAQDY